VKWPVLVNLGAVKINLHIQFLCHYIAEIGAWAAILASVVHQRITVVSIVQINILQVEASIKVGETLPHTHTHTHFSGLVDFIGVIKVQVSPTIVRFTYAVSL
jgi:hypothetical protein